MVWLRPTLLVFLPFAAGYYLSYLLRVINAVLAKPLSEEFELNAAQLGFVTSVYFLAFAAVQLPLGVALDRFGPRRVQAILLLLAACGTVTFALAQDLAGLLIGRGLIGLGVAGALIAGLKAIGLSFPKKRLPLVNGAFVAFGAAGAVTATMPVEWLLASIGWRGIFLLLAAATVMVSLLTLLLVVEPARPGLVTSSSASVTLRMMYTDPRFWRLAPMSTLCIGSAWALQGLWAAPWLSDVALLSRTEIVHHLFVMALALCAGALLIGFVADAVRHRSGGCETVLITAACIFMLAELALINRLAFASIVLWALVAGMGATTVLSYALLADLFPAHAMGRASAALNVLHIGGAFVIQTAIGFVVSFWPRDLEGRYQPSAYEAAFLILLLMQLSALMWFLGPYWRPAKLISPFPTRPRQDQS